MSVELVGPAKENLGSSVSRMPPVNNIISSCKMAWTVVIHRKTCCYWKQEKYCRMPPMNNIISKCQSHLHPNSHKSVCITCIARQFHSFSRPLRWLSILIDNYFSRPLRWLMRWRWDRAVHCLHTVFTVILFKLLYICSSQPSIVHWLSSSIFPCLVVRSVGCPAMVTPVQISLLVVPQPLTHTFSESLW